MFKDITLGQYMPGNTVVHRLDPRAKILLTIVYIAMVFTVGIARVLRYSGGVCVPMIARLAGLAFRQLLKSIKPLRILLILTFVLNLFFSGGQTVLWQWKFITISQEGLLLAVHFSLRLIFLVLGTSVLTLTTSPVALSDGIEILLDAAEKGSLPRARAGDDDDDRAQVHPDAD